MSWDFATDPEFEPQLEWVRGFVREEVEPLETLGLEATDDVFRAITAPMKAAVKERGLWATHLGPELGGQGFGQVKLALLNEILGRTRHAPEVFGCQAPDTGNAEILALYGTEAQKAAYLEPLLDGRIRSCFSMTEPNAGSDPTLLETRATPDGDGWVLDGHKWFSSNAGIAEFLIVMAVTDPGAEPHRRASMFLVPRATPGVNILREVAGMYGGPHHAEIRYDQVRLPGDALLGGEGDGFTIAQKRLGPGRLHHCMRYIGQMSRAFDMLRERAVSRFAHGSLHADKQTVQNYLADSWIQIHAARLMVLHAAWVTDQRGSSGARTEIAAAKVFVSGALHDVIDRALQIHGALGYSTDMPLEGMYRLARALPIMDGPDEVHRVTIARQALKGVQPHEGPWPSEHVPTRREAARRKFARFLDAATVE
ncbi:MAG: acyl-CoA dehydrogenase family protein [Actinomycetota bacterium]